LTQLVGRLIPQYREIHQGKRYRGGSTLRKHTADIAKLVREIPTATILDYGCGKGMQYTEDRLHEAWGGILPTLYDPGVPGIDDLPLETFDGVICTGVLEHIPRDELDQAFANLAGYARKWAFISVGCSPAHKRLPNGQNAHVTLQPEVWWLERLHGAFGDSIWLETVFIWK
jgi:hypothetical protein